MGIIRRAIALTGWTGLGASAGYVLWTRKCTMTDVPPTDYIWNTTLYARRNPYAAPVTHDICWRTVPLSKIRADLLEKDGSLVEAFCAGLWSGKGFAYQRRYLEKKWRGPETADQLWSTKELAQSKYEVGTKLVDHFEVVSKTNDSIIVRCGDSPRIQDLRESDGLFELTAEVKEAEGVAVFGLKSVFFNAKFVPPEDPAEKAALPKPMSATIQWLHAQYDKILMETALANVKR